MTYYDDKLAEGQEYQDFICDRLMRGYGICVGQYGSRKYQYEVGESASGIEIKYDKRMRETGNVYFEVAEKSNADNAEYVESGVRRKDNTWLYLIGDYSEALMFSKEQVLKSIYATHDGFREKNGIRRRQTATSIGYTFPVEFCKKFLCIRVFKFGGTA